MRITKSGEVVVSIGYSPCPNDTYIFDALVNGRIDTGKYVFEPELLDVQQLNLGALEGRLDVTKISFRVYADCAHHYLICNAGSALGRGVGPLLIAKPGTDKARIQTVAIPGVHTTANFLFRLYFSDISERKEILFSDIEDSVVQGTVDAGVIIHENRFTYKEKGLVEIADLGNLWEKETGQPIPLGCIAIKREFDHAMAMEIDQLIRKSIEFANLHPDASSDYVALHAQNMDPEVRQKHIELYVNDYSVQLGREGKKAVRFFLDSAVRSGVVSGEIPQIIFTDEVIP